MGKFEQMRANIRRAYESVRAARAEQEHHASQLELPPAPPAPEPELHHASTTSRDDVHVPAALRVAGGWAWRLIVIGIVFWGFMQVTSRLTIVVIPLIVATLLTALLAPAVGWLRRARVPRSLSAFIVVIGGLAAVVGTLTLVVNEFIAGAGDLGNSARDGLNQIQTWLKNGPLHLTDTQFNNYVQQVQDIIKANQDTLTTGALHTFTSFVEILSGMFLVLFALFFFLRDGRPIWTFFVRLLPPPAREPVDHAGVAAWASLGSYVRATVLVAFIDAVGIGVALAILDVPLVLPLAALVFLMSFIPIIGATLSGSVAVLVALVDGGAVVALIVLGAVIAVQQLEGHVLQPLIMGRAVSIHPLAVIIGIAGGLVLGGFVGALIAVPMIAMINTAVRHLSNRRINPSHSPLEDVPVVKA